MSLLFTDRWFRRRPLGLAWPAFHLPAAAPGWSLLPQGEGSEPMRAWARTRSLWEKSSAHYLWWSGQ